MESGVKPPHSKMTSLIIHGHFYQPPRENPWTGVVEEEPGAAPFHDWNERIHSECYGPNAAAQIKEPTNGQKQIINNYAHINFNFGPTLLSWLEQNHRETYRAILEADRESVVKLGHGNAIAQAYGHAILPLCNARDLRTQIRWGLADFRYRFGREAEAMWLPETACNDAVMEALIAEGMHFVILAPHQAARIRNGVRTRSGSDGVELKNSEWQSVNEQTIDTSVTYRYSLRHAADSSISVFFYDVPTSRAIAFENLLRSSRELADRLAQVSSGKEMINLATDGETYGHHFKFGDLCLGHLLKVEAPSRGFELTNYRIYLESHPPQFEVEIAAGPNGEGTSWSCIHGVGRWLRDCGCHAGGDAGWSQKWRAPLRQALDFLRDENVQHFEATRGTLFSDPWQARDDSIKLILDRQHSREKFLFEQAARWLSADECWRALTYLELQRMLLLMYTSCGWFFNDISGIETIQILKYAGRGIDLMTQLGLASAREKFLEILSAARSNRNELGSGADIYLRTIEPLKLKSTRENVLALL